MRHLAVGFLLLLLLLLLPTGGRIRAQEAPGDTSRAVLPAAGEASVQAPPGEGAKRGVRDELSQTTERLSDILSPTRILAALIVLIGAYFAIRAVTFVLMVLGERFMRQRLQIAKLVPILRIATWTLAVYIIIIEIFSPSTNTLVAFTASAGVAIGFASQDILKNIFGGIVIILDRPFQVGDRIQVGNHYGEVTNIGLRTVRLVTADDNLISVPNSEIVNQSVSNANAGALDCQVGVEFALPEGADLAEAKRVLYEAAVTSRYVYMKKPIVVVMKDDYEFQHLTRAKVKAYVLDHRYENAFASDITERAKAALKRTISTAAPPTPS